jgi:flagellar export protein FliJ
LARSEFTGFRFRAEAALDLRRTQETDAAAAFGRADAAARLAAETRSEAYATRDRAREDLAALGRRGTDVDTLVWHRNWIDHLGRRIADATRLCEARSAEAADARRAWEQARQKRRALEHLRDRALARFARDERRREAIAMDEIARLRYVSAALWRMDS